MENTRPVTYANLEPWLWNVIDLTLSDGSHRIGLLEKVDAEWAKLNPGRGNPALPSGGMVSIAGTASIVRASRN
jgi:hypothetical protein